MTRAEIIEKLKEIIDFANSGEQGKECQLQESSRIMQDLGFTSIGMLYISIAVEESFGIRFDAVGISDFVTLKDLVDYIAERVK